MMENMIPGPHLLDWEDVEENQKIGLFDVYSASYYNDLNEKKYANIE